ncbi:MAG: methyltransferase [Bacteroidia bacterium]|nr:methyltransferase [Bacteroidia bacterium]
MPKNIFVFKPFQIYQPFDDVMKVSTDSVLLGCFANAQNAQMALDIGCGTGLLSLMLAYKNKSLSITAIDINFNACICTQYNIKNSTFENKMEVFHTSIQDFTKNSKQKFDLIISNPPYFSNSLKSSVNRKNIYRHQESLNYYDLLHSVHCLLMENGSFYTLVPYYEQKQVEQLLSLKNLHIHSKLSVFSKSNKTIPYIFILEIKKSEANDIDNKHLFIYDEKGQYTLEYLELTKDFYLFS